MESRHDSKQPWTMWLTASSKNVTATRKKRPGPFSHEFTNQSHPRSSTFIWQINVSVSHMPLLSWVSIICSHIYILLYLSIGQVICLDEFCIFQLTNTSNRRHLQTQAVMEWRIIIRIIIMSTSVSPPMVCTLLRGHRSLKSTKYLGRPVLDSSGIAPSTVLFSSRPELLESKPQG